MILMHNRDEARYTSLLSEIVADLQRALDRLQDRAAKRRQIVKEVMVELDLKKLTAPDGAAGGRLPTGMIPASAGD